MPDFRFLVEFTVPDDVDLEERRDLPFTHDPLSNPTMTALRVALRADAHWRLQRVSSIRPDVDPSHQHLLVWVMASGENRDEARRAVQAGVFVVVNGVTTASFYGITEEP